MFTRRINLWFIVLVLVSTSLTVARAADLYYQDFESVPDMGTVDQAGWQSFTVATPTPPQVRDNSIAHIHDATWGHFLYARTAPIGLPNDPDNYTQTGAPLSQPFPTSGTVIFNAKAYWDSSNVSYSGGIGLMDAVGNNYQVAWELNYDSSPSQAFWALDARNITGQSYPNSFEFVPKATYLNDFYDHTVNLRLFIDLDQQKVWGSITNDANTSYTTSKYSFAGQTLNIATVSLGIDQRHGRVGGIDLDSVQVSALATPLRGDFNRDGHVDAADISSMLGAFKDLTSYQSSQGLDNTQFKLIADVNTDGSVTNADIQSLLLLLKNGGGSGGAVPEPEAVSLALMALLCLGVFRPTKAKLQRCISKSQ